MASAVLANRYTAAPGRPNSRNQKIGATTESFKFSANDSMALSRTCASVSAATSRLTNQPKRSRPACTDSPSTASTAITSLFSIAQASKGLRAKPSSAVASAVPTAACQWRLSDRCLGNVMMASCSTHAATQTTVAPVNQKSIPSPKRFKSGVSCKDGDDAGATHRPAQSR